MSKLYIIGGNKLNGEIEISSAKNTLLPILAGTILVDGVVKITNYTPFTDCEIMLDILKQLGAKVSLCNNELEIDATCINEWTINTALANKLRSSFFTLGAIIGRIGLAKVAYPGGCNIGARPVNIHLKALRQLGVSVIEKHGYIYANADKICSSNILFDFPSVGATENVMMVACTINGTTIINNCAKEPEILDLQNFLNACGANITGAGTDTIVVTGVGKLLHSASYTCISDRIIAGTYAIATACCGGDVTLNNINPELLSSLLETIRCAGVKIFSYKNKIRIKSSGKLTSVPYIDTKPYPHFPTDLQSQMVVMQAISKGNSMISENIFESRFKVVPELSKMGAEIVVKNNVAYINGVTELFGADVYASDLRAGASLVIAGLVAKGYTTINNVEYIDRGYYRIEQDLAKLGANIKRIIN